MAVARDLKGEDYKVICVIGDGALTGGMAMEALNHAGHLGTDLLVILNDNEMSISENVGAVSKYLTRLRTDPTYSRAKAEIEQLLRRLPAIGDKLTKTLEKIKDSMRHLVVPGLLFEAFGFKYLGPVDGHDLPLLIDVFQQASHLRGPVLIHVATEKGKGFPTAENAPDKFHSWPTAVKLDKPPAYTDVFADALIELARADERIVAVTAAMLPGTGLSKFQQHFPERCFDVGIAEQHAATFCAGLAAAGMRPVFAVYSTFMQRAYDQIIHDVAIQKLPVVFAVDRAGIVGPDGETHQGAFDLSYLRAIPNLTIMMPKDENELRHMLYTAFQLEGPVAVRYPRADGVGVPLDDVWSPVPVGKAEVVVDGRDAAIFALGPMVQTALKAAEAARVQYGLSIAVINMRFVKPLDRSLILKYAERMPVMTLEDAALAGGMGSAVAEVLADEQVSARLLRKGLPDRFIEHGGRDELLRHLGLDADGVIKDLVAFLGVELKKTSDVWP